ncbi:MAG: AI-2E family transporter [Caldilineaceae bacterium]
MSNQSLHESPPWSLTIKIIVAVVALLLGVLVIWRFQSLIPPIVMACILAYLLNPLINFSMQRLKISRGVAVLIVYSTLLLIAIGGGVALGIVAFEQASKLTTDFIPNSLPEAVGVLQKQFTTFIDQEFQLGPFPPIKITTLTNGLDLRALVQQAVDLIRPAFTSGGSLAAQLAQATISTLSLAFLVLVIAIYISRDTPKIWSSISDLAHQPGYRQDAERLILDFGRIWEAYLRGQVILGLVIGVIVSLTLSLLGVSNALGLGALSGILEFLPIIGPVIGSGTAILVAFFQTDTIWGLPSYQYALLVAGLMMAIQALENNILVPRIVGDALDLHPLLVMISVIMGASLAGVLGAVLAAPVVATIKLLGAYAWRKMLDLPPFPEPDPTASKQTTLPLAARLRLFQQRINQRWLANSSAPPLTKRHENGAAGTKTTENRQEQHPHANPPRAGQRKRSKNKR